MKYYENNELTIRSMIRSDVEKIIDGFKEQHWTKSKELLEGYYIRQEIKEHAVIIAEMHHHVAGYVILSPDTSTGPFASKNIPEIIDLNVFIKFQHKGIGNKLMDIAEKIAKQQSDHVSLAVGLHYGYGPAQKIYIQRGYIPDGSGAWYKGQQLEPYANCANDDRLILYLSKSL